MDIHPHHPKQLTNQRVISITGCRKCISPYICQKVLMMKQIVYKDRSLLKPKRKKITSIYLETNISLR